ncbi:glycosyltransferase family 2 protein [Halopseudomonas salegens]|uniref:Glycosyltransferase, catalytic subunit of cellulose synthase and poly-beta-1,6-N-acetylglucosamine synthase n=1 Tax=Halopseudomonas salegens TaxID=1434072 RepID=A0A1H2GJM2_9GAMM|nr:glycosyltransferase [Halopseudomonas salegens]SDU19682.1 Glycosyltransferase, catalytic subunit of cellulose synthase and poly-beta-1,6-N-acetylglucosamine synthase [Halopseudomonas salegens]
MVETPILTLHEIISMVASADGVTRLLLLLFPFFLLIELPMNLLIAAGVVRWYSRKMSTIPAAANYAPTVSCIITCYSEGRDVLKTLETLCEQVYPGDIELIPVIDGAAVNQETLQVIRDYRIDSGIHPRRHLKPIAKWQRGGRVSSLNAGLQQATGDIVLALDGDTSFDNTMVSSITRHFVDPGVPAVAGSLRVRNMRASLITRIQALEYFLSIHVSKTGLSEWNTVNNISGAFGAFRREFLLHIGGWDTHSAEDLDITLRIKGYFARHPLRIPFEPAAVGHTDAPVTLRQFLMQRLRWDGDLFFLYIRKHSHSMTPRLLGWPNFLMTLITGFFFQLVLPFMIVGYTLAALVLLPVQTLLILTTLVYLVYLAVTLCLYVLGLLLVSERPRDDLRLLAVVPLFPVFMFGLRCWGVVCTMNEVLRRGHEETSMAPWWVLKKGKRF